MLNVGGGGHGDRRRPEWSVGHRDHSRFLLCFLSVRDLETISGNGARALQSDTRKIGRVRNFHAAYLFIAIPLSLSR